VNNIFDPRKENRPMLTRKQLELLDFIQKRMAHDGVPPSI